jgi:mono/diheme cytochrome c family protein
MNKPGIWAVLVALSFCTACRQDMQDQPKYKPLGENRFFPDGRNSRPVPANTIAIDELNVDDPNHTGVQNGAFIDTIPATINVQLLNRGRDRYDIFCSPCHGRLGDGNGMVAQRGVRAPANFHTDRLRSVPPGYMFQVITNGYGGMGDYGDQVPVDDRWAIVAYIRALQYSHNATINDVPADARAQLGVQP